MYKYRNNGRRAYHLSKRFQKKVALATGHTLLYNDIQNTQLPVALGTALFYQLDLGYSADDDFFLEYAKKHWIHYKEPDPNTTVNNIAQYKMKLKVMDFRRTVFGVNSSTNHMYVTVYSLTPRHNIHNGNLFPQTALSTFMEGGNLPDVSNNTSIATDVDFTPYRVPAITANYKISKTRSFSVHPGGSFSVGVQNSYDINNGLDSAVAGWDPTIFIKKGHYKAILVKIVGGLGVATNGDGRFIRNLETEAVCRIVSKAKLHVAEEERDIIYNLGLTQQRTLAGLTAQKIINEETGQVVDIIALDPTTDS